LILPNLGYTGVVCVDFYYHMFVYFGNYVGELRLVQAMTTTSNTTVWSKSGSQKDKWLHGIKEVNISPNSQVCYMSSLSVYVSNLPGCLAHAQACEWAKSNRAASVVCLCLSVCLSVCL